MIINAPPLTAEELRFRETFSLEETLRGAQPQGAQSQGAQSQGTPPKSSAPPPEPPLIELTDDAIKAFARYRQIKLVEDIDPAMPGATVESLTRENAHLKERALMAESSAANSIRELATVKSAYATLNAMHAELVANYATLESKQSATGLPDTAPGATVKEDEEKPNA